MFSAITKTAFDWPSSSGDSVTSMPLISTDRPGHDPPRLSSSIEIAKPLRKLAPTAEMSPSMLTAVIMPLAGHWWQADDEVVQVVVALTRPEVLEGDDGAFEEG